MVWLTKMPDSPVNYGSRESQHLHLWDNISEILTFKRQIHDPDRDSTEKILQAEEQILERVEAKSDISTRRFAAEIGVSQFVVYRTLKEQDVHPHHVQKLQALEPAEFPHVI